jgi:hypothetical protein
MIILFDKKNTEHFVEPAKKTHKDLLAGGGNLLFLGILKILFYIILLANITKSTHIQKPFYLHKTHT